MVVVEDVVVIVVVVDFKVAAGNQARTAVVLSNANGRNDNLEMRRGVVRFILLVV
jgi:hypothetical protein